MALKNKTNTSRTQSKPKSDKRISKAGYEFDVYEDQWQLTSSESLNLSLLNDHDLPNNFKESLKLTLADYAAQFSSTYAQNLLSHSRLLLLKGVTKQIEESHVINFKASLNKETEWKLGYIRAFLFDWYEKDKSFIDIRAIKLLESLIISGNTKGRAVALGCPYSGAYTHDEQIALIRWYVDAYTDKQITLEEYAFIAALQFTGARPIQIRHLYFGDLITRDSGNISHYDLQLPNAKKRHESIRESFHLKSEVEEDLILLLSEQGKRSIKTIESHYEVKLTDEQKKNVPVFLRISALSEAADFKQFADTQKIKPDVFCMGRNNGAISKVARLCPLKTSRIRIEGEYGDLHINPRRFRYTHATNMAMLGASDLAIADELGHSDTQQVQIYTEFNEDIASQLDDALAPSLIPLAQAFSGTLIDGEKDAIRANDPRSLINNNNGESVGNCGQYGFCANGNIHCYTCNKFEPWVNARHEEFLLTVEAERDRKKQMGASEFVLQSHNQTIDAIKIVVDMCEKRKEELKNEGSVNV
jgi:integrase